MYQMHQGSCGLHGDPCFGTFARGNFMLIVTRTAEVRVCMPHSNGTCQSCVMRFTWTDPQTG